MSSKIQRKGQRGFTLIELLLVLVILAMLGALILPRIFGTGEGAKVKVAALQISRISMAVENFYLDTGSTPDRLEQLINDAGGTNGFSFGSQLAGSVTLDTDHEIEFDWELVSGSVLRVWAFIDGVFFGVSGSSANAQRNAASTDFIHIGTEGGGTEQFNEPVTSIKYRNIKLWNEFQHGASAGDNYTPIF